MQFSQTKNQIYKRVIKRIFILSLIVMTALGAIIADTATKQRDFAGQIKLSICGSDGKGGWVVKDSIVSNLRFGFTVADLASGKTIRSDFVWTGRTAKGASFRARLLGQGQATFNPANGAIEQRLPIEVEVNEKKESFQISLTTEQVKTVMGSLSGKRAQISGNIGEMALVGESLLSQVSSFENPAGIKSAQVGNRLPGKKDSQVAVIAELKGQVIAK